MTIVSETINTQTREGQERLKELGIKPIPEPDDVTRPYWDAARSHELHIRKCLDCSKMQHPPRPACPSCGSEKHEWVKVSGDGVVYTFIIDYRLMVPGFDKPYVVAQVNPVEAQDDTVRVVANVIDCPIESVYIGMPVEVVFEDVSDAVTLPQFRPRTA